MSALFQGVAAMQRGAGRLHIAISGAAPHHFHNGIPYDEDGSVAMSTAVPHHFHQGLGFTANGRIARVTALPDYFGSGAAPFFSANAGRISTATTGVSWYSGGVGYQATSRLSALETPPPPPPALITPQVLTVGQFPNINKRGYRNPSIGSLVPVTNPQFNIEELLINSGTGKLVLRGVETAPWNRIEVDGVPFLKANATFDGFDTWRWSTPVTWLVGTTHTIVFVV